MTDQKDEKLWRLAKKRASFKKSLFSYFVVNTFLWFIYWYSHDWKIEMSEGIPWPLWVMIGWGFGLAFQYFEAYSGDKVDLAEKEYEKLKKGN